MWLKKLFNNSQAEKGGQNEGSKKFEEEDDVMASTIHIDIQPDIRYKLFKQLPHNSDIKFPLVAVHDTENIVLHEINLFNAKTHEGEDWKQVNIMLTDRQLLISPNLVEPNAKKSLNYYSISYGSIQKMELIVSKKKEPTRLKILMHNARQLHLKCVLGDLVNRAHDIITNFAFAKGVNKFYAYRYGELNRPKQQQYKGWKVYNIKREFLRQGLITFEQGGVKLRYCENLQGEVSSTYPQLLVIPSKLTDAQLTKCAQFRTKERFPALTYILEYKTNKYSTLFRCSQNKVGVLYARSKEDELMIQYIGDLNLDNGQAQKSKNCKIYDARGYYAALGNMFAGKGYEKPQFYTNCEIQWLNIPNIHAVRDTYNAIMNYRCEGDNFLALCAQAGWYDYLYLILAGAKSIAQDLMNGINVVVHCSDGWDRTSQLCALSQLIIDPYYRTIEGFAVLVEKDWRHFGHKFRSRTGQYNAAQYHPYEKSPVFIQFLDCVYQIMQQFPLSFEFSDKLLQFLAKNVDSNVYGNFMANNIQEANQLQLSEKTISIWSHVFQNALVYRNPFYEIELNQSWLNVGTEPKHMTVWRSLFLGDGDSGSTYAHIMRHEKDMNGILKTRFYNNQKEIEELTKRLAECDK